MAYHYYLVKKLYYLLVKLVHVEMVHFAVAVAVVEGEVVVAVVAVVAVVDLDAAVVVVVAVAGCGLYEGIRVDGDTKERVRADSHGVACGVGR